MVSREARGARGVDGVTVSVAWAHAGEPTRQFEKHTGGGQTTLPLFRKVDCVRLPVRDLEEGLAFYRDRLGHELIWRTETQAGLRMPETDAEIVIHTEPEVMEIDLLVESAVEAAAAVESAGGRVVVPSFEIQIGWCAVVEDPWGNRLVILDMSKGAVVTGDAGNVVGTQGAVSEVGSRQSKNAGSCRFSGEE